MVVDPGHGPAVSPASRTDKRASGADEGRAPRLSPQRIARGAALRPLPSVLALLAVLYTLVLAKGVLLPVFLAVFLSILLHPIVARLEKWKLPRILGAGIVVAAMTGALVITAQRVLSPVTAWIDRGAPLPPQLVLNLEALQETIDQVLQAANPLFGLAGPSGGGLSAAGRSGLVTSALAEAGDAAVLLAVVVVLVFFLLAKGADTLAQSRRAFVDAASSDRWAGAMLDIKREIGRYLMTITVINTVLGCATALGMALVGMPNPLLWGCLAGVLNFMPYLGTVTTTSIITAAAFLTFDTWSAILLPPSVFFGLTILEGNFLTPMIIGHRLTLNPISVFVSFLFWGWAWGPAGVLIAIPILAVLKITVSHIPPLRRYGVLFG